MHLKLDGLAYQGKFNYTLYPISFPTENAAEWKKLFKPCASQRLFLPLILKDVDSLLYVDTDILFLRPVDDIWYFLKKFNSSQIAAMAPEHEEPRIGWYNRFARHPYYGKTGINSGVMLMNMTRIRRKYFKLTTMVSRKKKETREKHLPPEVSSCGLGAVENLQEKMWPAMPVEQPKAVCDLSLMQNKEGASVARQTAPTSPAASSHSVTAQESLAGCEQHERAQQPPIAMVWH
ncbi:UNVERIFIED_CONTAM: hypothetical protein K2H54_066480 [Gekko kuhli]